MKIPNGLKTVMMVLAEEEKTNKALIYAFKSVQNPDAVLSLRRSSDLEGRP